MCYDGDPADVFTEKTRKARAEHQCYECRNLIERAESYLYITMLYDGRWSSYHICRFCAAAGEWLNAVCGGYAIGNLYDELQEHWDEDTLYRSHWLGRAIIGRRNRWDGWKAPLPDPRPLLQRRGLRVYGVAA